MRILVEGEEIPAYLRILLKVIALLSARLEPARRQRRRGQRIPGVAANRTELPGRPGVTRGHDLFGGAGDEVPPHDQPLAKRRAADDEESARTRRGQRYGGNPYREVREHARLD